MLLVVSSVLSLLEDVCHDAVLFFLLWSGHWLCWPETVFALDLTRRWLWSRVCAQSFVLTHDAAGAMVRLRCGIENAALCGCGATVSVFFFFFFLMA